MAFDLLLFETFSEVFDEELETWLVVCSVRNQMIGCISCCKRESVPSVQDYMQTVVSCMDLPEHIDDFSVHFRLSRNTFNCILESVSETLMKKNRGPHEAVPPEKKLLAFLCYIGNQESMREVAHLFNLSKSTLHEVIKDVCSSLLGIGHRIIQWPSHEKQTVIARNVQEACGLPGIIGFIDGTHVCLTAALGGDHDYFNRKGYPSIQLQIVVDDQMMITHAYTGWPGCTHDARVLRNSSLYHKAEDGELFMPNSHILGDNAYPLRNWLITPFKNFGHLTEQQIRFNKKVSSVRQTVERAFGHIKGRFRRLREVPLHTAEDICRLIYAGCILHNLCVLHEDDVQMFIEEDMNVNPNRYPNVYQNGHNGVLRRLQLLNYV